MLQGCFSPPHRDLRDIAPLSDALGVVGVDGAVFPLGGGRGEGGGVDVVWAGIEGEEGPLAVAAVFLDLDAFLGSSIPEDFYFAAVGAEGDFWGEGGGIGIDGIRADDAESGAHGSGAVSGGLGLSYG